jgi:hypothetical protein
MSADTGLRLRSARKCAPLFASCSIVILHHLTLPYHITRLAGMNYLDVPHSGQNLAFASNSQLQLEQDVFA